MHRKKVIPASKSVVYDLLKRFKNNEVIYGPWNLVGRKRILTDSEVSEIAEELVKDSGKSFNRLDLKDRIESIEKQK